ncbi:hypothetical protein BaRGS_00021150 [Batillaria attramentaria]|uniref:Uncharacterized protein n=1 Tax=Batillaria attramentaria TaxID=370345 RepID=A0ABD0KLB4_9CAEN
MWQTDVRMEQSEFINQKSECGSQKSECGSQKSQSSPPWMAKQLKEKKFLACYVEFAQEHERVNETTENIRH